MLVLCLQSVLISFSRSQMARKQKVMSQDSITSLIVVDSHSSFLSCVPMEGKAQLDHANREIIKFVQMLGYSEIILHCDNEPAKGWV